MCCFFCLNGREIKDVEVMGLEDWALLPAFYMGTELRIIAEVANSVGSRKTAPRSLVIAESIG